LSKLEDDLVKQINRMLNEGEIEGIFFQEYTLMGN
jgi:flagellar basal body-associated protein FliL